ncbi:hypothetical protein BDL97_16G064900 [Sphagnum fallax]|nr:hypothetical protein BDL97_16G064900 [Sphagnum fallax]KAH8938102.1 hypothetical protein BDL97_16G064900 [Sphagnum fallax]KAH8938109.1 hypothetical protein BDL97_16G064900 [Sphagnum fallax]
MGDPERWPQASSLTPEGVSLFSAAFSASVAKGNDWWAKAEEWAAELITCIQPTWSSEKRRQSVVDYVQFLIRRGIDCQVVTFGSVPLKTYLPDGDIDLTAFSLNHVQKDTWAEDVHRILEKAEQNSDSEFRVKEVQLIHAEVKIVKCLVENIVVDISFNQIGGLCTLCFLEEVDRLVGQDHLFKRSVILVKAWCYYESRILGAHHGLISTYALETLVLYIFHVFHSSLRGPLQVLYMFLEFFSNFDWDRYCVSLWGPVPLASVPVVAGRQSISGEKLQELAEPPRIDGGELLLTKAFLDACSETYGIVPIGQDAKSNMFHMKFLNIIDPLRIANNLGRSVSKGNFCRIRSAFGFGARKLARIVNTSKGKVAEELNTIFDCTLTRHGGHQRPDASDPTHKLPLAPTSGAGIFSSENKSAEWSTLGSKEILHPPSVGETFDPGICRPDFHTFSQPMPADTVGMQSMRASKAILNHVTGYQGMDTMTALSSSAGESQSAEGNCRECGEGLTNGGNSNGNVGVIKCEISRCMSCYASGQTTLVKSRNGQDPSLEAVINHCGNLFGTPVDIAAESSQQIMPSEKSGSGYLVDNSSSQNGSPVVRTEKESCIRIAAQSTHGLAPPSLSGFPAVQANITEQQQYLQCDWQSASEESHQHEDMPSTTSQTASLPDNDRHGQERSTYQQGLEADQLKVDPGVRGSEDHHFGAECTVLQRNASKHGKGKHGSGRFQVDFKNGSEQEVIGEGSNGTSSNLTRNPIGSQVLGVGDGLKAVGVPIRTSSKRETIIVDQVSNARSGLLASDFGRHLQDLANGLWCQRPPIPSTTFLPAPRIALSTKDLHINGLWKGQGQPRHNMSTHMGFSPLHQVPFTMVQSQGQMAAASYQQLPISFSSVEVSARPRGTGTYLPILRQNVHRDRRSHGGKQGGGQNGYYGQKDRTNSTVHHEGTTQSPRSSYRGGSRVQQSRQGLWLPSQNANEGGQGEQKVSGSGRGHVHHRLQQQVQLDRESYQSPPATLSGSNSSAVSVTPGGTYPLPYSSNRETLTGHHVPPVVSVYEANESKMSFQPDSLEFGSFGPGINSAKLVDGGLEKLSHECTLPHDPVDIPGSPCSSDLSPRIELQQFTSHPQRDTEVQQTYQMKEEDFPPLSFCQQQASSTAVSNGGSSSS